MSIPIIETDRPQLCPFQLSDVTAYSELIYSNPDVMRYLGASGTVPDRPLEAAQNTIIKLNSVWENQSFGGWAMEERNSGAFMGHAGLGFIGDTNVIEIAYALGKPFWGKGYATEIARVVLRYGFETAELDEIVGVAFEQNTASLRVLEKIGMRKIGLTDMYYGVELVSFKLTQTDYNALQSNDNFHPV